MKINVKFGMKYLVGFLGKCKLYLLMILWMLIVFIEVKCMYM